MALGILCRRSKHHWKPKLFDVKVQKYHDKITPNTYLATCSHLMGKGADSHEYFLCLYPQTSQLNSTIQTLILDGICWNWSNYWLPCDPPQKISSIFKCLLQCLWNIWRKNLKFLYVKLILFQSLWLAHVPHGPQTLQCSNPQNIPRSPWGLLALLTYKPASTTGLLSGYGCFSVPEPTLLSSVAPPVGIAIATTSPKTDVQ